MNLFKKKQNESKQTQFIVVIDLELDSFPSYEFGFVVLDYELGPSPSYCSGGPQSNLSSHLLLSSSSYGSLIWGLTYQ